jgi:plastocyanin
MKSNSTFLFIRTFVLLSVSVFLTLSLPAQTSQKVSVTNYVFSPAQITITAGDTVIWKNNGGSHNVNGKQTTFSSNPASFGNSLGSGWTYKFVFTTAGTYNYQCDPHAAMGMVGKVIVNPKPEILTLTINFMDMEPHNNEPFYLAVIDQTTKKEIYRLKTKVTPSFSIQVPGIEKGKSYWVDFFADHNYNGVYNTPPADHSYRMTLNNVTGNSELHFMHTTDFTAIDWKTKLTVHFTGMAPYVGQKLTLYLRNTDKNVNQDTVVVNQITGADFDVASWKIKPGLSYKIDFYVDVNKNGVYNSPPTDHAWRNLLNKVVSDTIISFANNTNYTDIFSITGAEQLEIGTNNIRLYPNPASQYVELLFPPYYAAIHSIKIY